jgi:hypothetical protein
VPLFDFLKKKKIKINVEDKSKTLSVSEFIKELGIGRERVVGSYDTEENTDSLEPDDYIEMQRNDGEVQAIVRLLTLPIVSTSLYVAPARGDKGERDFIENVFFNPPSMGGMSTPLPFVVADMTRGIFEGFRLYEKVAKIIEEGDYKGKIGWRKLAPRDARTVSLRSDEHGGFNGAFQSVFFGTGYKEIIIPPEKCMLFTFQKEKNWLYGESILRTAYYHYDKKHKLYYISYKKAEIDTLGLKILKIGQTTTTSEREAAENVVDTLGVNTRITLPPGVELEIQRGGESGFDLMPLIDHHNQQMAKSALVQVLDQVKYAYPYGKGTPASQYVDLAIESIMKQIESTLNTYAVAPLIDWNFGTNAYPQIKFEKLADSSVAFLRDVFGQIIKGGNTLPEGFINEIVSETAKVLKLKWSPENVSKVSEKNNVGKKAYSAFENGKKGIADKLNMDAPKTPLELKKKLLSLKFQPGLEEKCHKLGEKFANGIYNKKMS